jgi:hypothetical protein
MKKNKVSFVYYNIFIYRLVMNILYGFKYRKRFEKVVNLIHPEDKSVTELCFGDIFIAQYCQKKDKRWIGFDLNDNFVEFAKKNNFNACLQDIMLLEEFPQADVFVMVGSLYHFNSDLKGLFEKIRQASQRFILSEPVINLTNQKGVVGKFSKKFTNAGKGEEAFRFNEKILLERLESLKNNLKFDYQVIDQGKDMIIEIKWKK